MVFEEVVIIDARDHILGRLASIVAKELLQGQRVVVTRCEGIVVTGSLLRTKQAFLRYLNKRTNTKPSRGPFHHRSPSRMFFRVCRGMLPHKTARGASALARLRVYEGIPPEYSRKKRMVVPDALRVLRHTPGRKVTQLGLLAKEVGWKYADTVEAFEIKRKRNSLRFYKKKLANRKSLLASRSVINNKISNKLENFGY